MSETTETIDKKEESASREAETLVEAEPTSKPDAVLKGRDYLKSLLDKKMMILTRDGRVLIGRFHCTDKQLNIILEGCNEYQSVEEMKKTENKSKKKARYHNLVIIAEKFIANIFVHKG